MVNNAELIYWNNYNLLFWTSFPLTGNLSSYEDDIPVYIIEGNDATCQLVFSGVCVTRSFVLCVCFVDRCLSFCTLSFGHCVVCPSSIYGFWLPLWYLLTLLVKTPSSSCTVCCSYVCVVYLSVSLCWKAQSPTLLQ